MLDRQAIYLRIIERGLLDIRNHADDREQVFAQADHLHNMPDLLANLDDEQRHEFYWNRMRPSYLSGCKTGCARMFDDLWAQLEQLSPPSDGG